MNAQQKSILAITTYVAAAIKTVSETIVFQSARSQKEMKKSSAYLATLIAPLAFAVTGHAQIISIQFLQSSNSTALGATQSAGAVPAEHYNPSLPSESGLALTNNAGNSTTAALTVSSGGYFTSNTFPSGGNNILLSSGLNSAGGGNISLAAIPYTTGYDVYVYGVSDNGSNDGGSAGLTTTFALTPTGGATQYFSLQPVTNSSSFLQSTNTYDGTGAPPTDFVLGANYVEFTGLTSADFGLVFSGENSSGTPGGFNASLNGIQIVADPVIPEPSTWAMVAAGLGLLLFAQRRIRRTLKA